MTPFIPRAIEGTLAAAARTFPAVVLTGPRQSGKTTLLRHRFGATNRYVSLEPPDVRAAAIHDPRGFLDAAHEPVILDEIQYAPDLLPYVKERIDEHRDVPGRFLLSGSQNLLLMTHVSESLAGRAAVLHLLPLSHRERMGHLESPAIWERRRMPRPSTTSRSTAFWADALRGGYPELAAHPRRDPGPWFSSFVQTYLERDVRTIRQVGDLTQFQMFLRTLAARSGQLLNMVDVGRDLGLAVNTVKAWVSVLEATHQILILRPYFANIGKRLVKTPKIYFTDTGLLCHLVGLRDAAHARAGPLSGAIAETAVVIEILKLLRNRGEEPELYFWRTATGDEVDLLVRTATGLVPIEIKATATPAPMMAAGIARLRRALPAVRAGGFVVHTGSQTLPLGDGVTAVPFDFL